MHHHPSSTRTAVPRLPASGGVHWLARWCAALPIALALSCSAVVSAQTPEADTSTLDAITVTGSRIKRTEVETALPVTVIQKQEIEAQGISSAEQLMMYLNIAGNGSDNLSSNTGIVSEEQRGNNGVSGANLRGQGADATLVLLNGRRVATHGLKGRAVDLNAIPFAAIERVEVLRDGASAVYGTDAIGGVINFITRTDYQGLQVSAFMDATEAGGGNLHSTNLLFGRGDLDTDRWNAFVSVSVKSNEILRGNQRKFSNALQPERGLSPDTRGPPFATIFTQNGGMMGELVDPIDGSAQRAVNILNLPGAAGCDSADPMMGAYDYRLWGGPSSRYACTWDYPAAAVILQPQRSQDVLGRAEFRLNDQHELFFEFSGSKVTVRKSFEPNQISSSANPAAAFNPNTWYPLNPTTQATYDMLYNALKVYFGENDLTYGAPIPYRWRCIACGPRQIETTTTAFRMLAGVRGGLGTWDYDIGLSRASSRSQSQLGSGYHYLAGLQQVLGSGELNPFLLPGQSQSAQAMAALNAVSATGVKLYGGESTMTTLDASFSGGLGLRLPGGEIIAATGIDLRREEFGFNGNPVGSSTIFNAPFDEANALGNVHRDVKAVFAEFYLPILDTLELTLAGRYDRYDGFGSTTNPKISFKWQPLEALAFRGAYSTGFKVPSFNQLYNGVSESQYAGLDLADPATCPSGIVDPTDPGCLAIRPDIMTGGKDDLEPEESKQKSLGLVFAPVHWFNMSIDWWEIERTNTIRLAPLQALIDHYNLFAHRWIRDAKNEVVTIDRRYVNSGGTLTRGIELDAHVTGELAGGQWRVDLNGSYIDLFKTKDFEVLPYSDNLVGDYVRYYNLPIKWKHTLSFGWARGNWGHRLTQIYRAGYNDELPVSVKNGRYIPAHWDPKVSRYITYNYSLDYTGFDKLRLVFGVKNLLDRDPPFTAHQNDYAAGAAWEPRIADPRGRAYTLAVEYRFF